MEIDFISVTLFNLEKNLTVLLGKTSLGPNGHPGVPGVTGDPLYLVKRSRLKHIKTFLEDANIRWTIKRKNG